MRRSTLAAGSSRITRRERVPNGAERPRRVRARASITAVVRELAEERDGDRSSTRARCGSLTAARGKVMLAASDVHVVSEGGGNAAQ
jgi:hypothetical protein